MQDEPEEDAKVLWENKDWSLFPPRANPETQRFLGDKWWKKDFGFFRARKKWRKRDEWEQREYFNPWGDAPFQRLENVQMNDGQYLVYRNMRTKELHYKKIYVNHPAYIQGLQAPRPKRTKNLPSLLEDPEEEEKYFQKIEEVNERLNKIEKGTEIKEYRHTFQGSIPAAFDSNVYPLGDDISRGQGSSDRKGKSIKVKSLSLRLWISPSEEVPLNITIAGVRVIVFIDKTNHSAPLTSDILDGSMSYSLYNNQGLSKGRFIYLHDVTYTPWQNIEKGKSRPDWVSPVIYVKRNFNMKWQYGGVRKNALYIVGIGVTPPEFLFTESTVQYKIKFTDL